MDVIIFVDSEFNSWADQRGSRQRVLFEEKGLSVSVSFEKGRLAIAQILDTHHPKVVFNELWHINSRAMRILAGEFPETEFVCMEHQSSSFSPEIDMHTHYSEKDRLRRVAKEMPNVHSATVMRKELFPDGFLEFPNLVRYLRLSERKSNDFVLSLVTRYDKLKNIAAQVQAVCNYAKTARVSLLIVSHNLHLFQRDARYLIEAKVPFRVLPWQDWGNYIEMVDQFVDVGLQCSLTESFNLVSIEHMMMGKPVIGTTAIEHIPDEWSVRAHDVNEIAEKIGWMRLHCKTQAEKAREIALDVQERNSKVFFESLASLMG